MEKTYQSYLKITPHQSCLTYFLLLTWHCPHLIPSIGVSTHNIIWELWDIWEKMFARNGQICGRTILGVCSIIMCHSTHHPYTQIFNQKFNECYRPSTIFTRYGPMCIYCSSKSNYNFVEDILNTLYSSHKTNFAEGTEECHIKQSLFWRKRNTFWWLHSLCFIVRRFNK